MSVDSVIDSALTILLGKAREGLGAITTGGGGGGGGTTTQPQAIRPATINFEFTGGAHPIAVTSASIPTSCDPYQVEVPFPSTIASAHLYAGDPYGNPVACSATIDVRMTQFGTWGSFVRLYGSGQIPTLLGDSANNVNLSGWNTFLTTGDVLQARLVTFSGQASWVVLILQLRPTDTTIGLLAVTSSTGDPIVDSSGNPIVLRS